MRSSRNEDFKNKRRDKDQEKYERDPRDLRHNLAIKRRQSENKDERSERRDIKLVVFLYYLIWLNMSIHI